MAEYEAKLDAANKEFITYDGAAWLPLNNHNPIFFFAQASMRGDVDLAISSINSLPMSDGVARRLAG